MQVKHVTARVETGQPGTDYGLGLQGRTKGRTNRRYYDATEARTWVGTYHKTASQFEIIVLQ